MTAAQERFRGIRDDETLDGGMQDKNILAAAGFVW